jgi:YjbE family integral membrane protein
MTWNLEFVTSVLQILVIDVVLSGDNAVVIAMAAHRLPQRQRRLAILCGAGGAIALRVLFTWVLSQLLGVPFLRLGGGLVLVWIAMKLLLAEQEADVHKVHQASSMLHAVWIIIMADFVMSLDNMLAVGGASEGSAQLILFGLMLSIAIIMTCSAIIAELMNRFPVLVLLGAAVLAYTAGEMIVEDEKVVQFLAGRTRTCMSHDWDKYWERGEVVEEWFGEATPALRHEHWIAWSVIGGVVLLVVTCPYWRRVSAGRRMAAPPSVDLAPAPLDAPRRAANSE